MGVEKLFLTNSPGGAFCLVTLCRPALERTVGDDRFEMFSGNTDKEYQRNKEMINTN